MGRFVKNTLIDSLEQTTVELPDGPNGEMISVPISDVGISHPWIVRESTRLSDEIIDPESGVQGGDGGRRPGGRFGAEFGGEGGPLGGDAEEKEMIKLKRYDFVVQFCWIPTTKAERAQRAEARALAAEQAKAAAAEQEASGGQ